MLCNFACTLPLLANASTLSFKFLLLVLYIMKINPNAVWILKVLYFPYFDFKIMGHFDIKLKKWVLPIFCSTCAHFVKMLFRWFASNFLIILILHFHTLLHFKSLYLEREGLIHHRYDRFEFVPSTYVTCSCLLHFS